MKNRITDKLFDTSIFIVMAVIVPMLVFAAAAGLGG